MEPHGQARGPYVNAHVGGILARKWCIPPAGKSRGGLLLPG